MFLQDLLKICLVVLDGFGGIFTGLIQGDLIKVLQLFIYCHYISPAYSCYGVLRSQQLQFQSDCFIYI